MPMPVRAFVRACVRVSVRACACVHVRMRTSACDCACARMYECQQTFTLSPISVRSPPSKTSRSGSSAHALMTSE